MKRAMSGREALTMGVALIVASYALVMSLAGSPMVSLALQNTETATAVATEAATGSPDAATTPIATSSMAMVSCVDTAAASSEATTEGTAAATAEMTAAATDMEATSAATSTPTTFLGVVVAAVGDCGVRVSQVIADSPAALGQVAVGDLIVAVNGVTVTELTTAQSARPEGMMNYASLTTAGFFAAIRALPAGTVATLTVQRGGEQLDLSVTLVELGPDATPSDIEGTLQASGTPDMTISETLEATAEMTATP